MRNRSSDIIDNMASKLESKISAMVDDKINKNDVSETKKASFTRNDIYEFGALQMMNVREHSLYATFGNFGGGSVGP